MESQCNGQFSPVSFTPGKEWAKNGLAHPFPGEKTIPACYTGIPPKIIIQLIIF